MLHLPETFEDLQHLIRSGVPLRALPQRCGSVSLRDLRAAEPGAALLDVAFLARLTPEQLGAALSVLDHTALRDLSSHALDGNHLTLGTALAAQWHGAPQVVNHAQVILAPHVYDATWFRDHAGRITDTTNGRHMTAFRTALRQMNLSAETLLSMTPLRAELGAQAQTLSHLLTLDDLPGAFLARHAQALAQAARTWTADTEEHDETLRAAAFLIAHKNLPEDDARALTHLPDLRSAIALLECDDTDHRVAYRADRRLFALRGASA
ncbi:hypothetical protein [Deinococcus soli (ex Cha et al. 2016)]|uniref:Uncharacterized protein n=2 Tax=Deinococcus soli (ex Cha et al. 2016) TaxID=1309411 RepID=A0ACC6KGI8_9DEIO|nr:hypothetical protein [Deinococcus soli (ex Cha et al. 2016)]MDR6219032.1 hypothetical protein [Deinococcus soli (ex Cha et al. 2016)]MDR6328829.1 hypothetical protein [Deinococcus soli (ex Cha et al. 2016)]MDR6751683.1 hypothetical protein [Deinococcus soli (ex Cha et al. 2016)]